MTSLSEVWSQVGGTYKIADKHSKISSSLPALHSRSSPLVLITNNAIPPHEIVQKDG